MKRPKSFSAWVVVVLSLAGVLYTVIVGNRPLLGLDLQGGVSVTLQPVGPADDESLDQTLEIIRSRVDALGVAEPEISRQGDTIVVDLPGIDEQQRALDLVGQTAELRFRPVIAPLGPEIDLSPLEDGETGDGKTGNGGTDSTDAGTGGTDSAGDEEGFGPGVRSRQSGSSTTEAPTSTTRPATDATTSTETSGGIETTQAPSETLSPEELAIAEACSISGVTPPEDNLPASYVVLADADGLRYCLGPSELGGDALETADIAIYGVNEFSVNPVFKSGPEGIDAFNGIAAECFKAEPSCPTRQLAIVLDELLLSAPTINAADFKRDSITISGSFDEESARDLALVLRYGALPIELEPQAVRTVSATIGSDALRAGIIAGVIGLLLVSAYLLFYYRLAALVVIGGFLFSTMLLWTIIAWLGDSRGLAITLAGVVGLIVSIGVAGDSNIVYFETVKDLAREGKRVGTSIERGYGSAIGTIVKADVVSLIAAGLLYFLTVGAVKGFAFYLGLATLLDLVMAVWFMRPALAWLARLPAVQANPRLIGLTAVGAGPEPEPRSSSTTRGPRRSPRSNRGGS